MLSDAVDAFLESVSERAFDQPLLAIIRAQGFERVHLTHGAREFGKDAIGQRDGEQWAWQSKAGDVGQSQWRQINDQLDELRLVKLGHGAFDGEVPRRPVLVITGRLIGNAPDLFRDYNERAEAKGEPTLELWDRETLIGFLAESPDALLRGSMDGQLFATLGSVDAGSTTMDSVEHFSRRWSTWEPVRIAGLGVIEAATVCERLAAGDRLDLACHLALCLVRGSVAAGADPEISSAAGEMFETYAGRLLESREEILADEPATESGASAWVSYPVRCVRIAEIAGLLALRIRDEDPARAEELAGWLVRFLATQPGAAHPVSDSYAVSLIPTALALALVDREAARIFLRSATIWLCDAYERDRLGLASAEAAPKEEVERLLGCASRGSSWSVGASLRSPRSSWTWPAPLGSAICTPTYGMTSKRFAFTRESCASPMVPISLTVRGWTTVSIANVDFAESLGEEEPIAPHHLDPAGTKLCEEGRAWELLAVSSAVRDRHFYCALKALVVGADVA